MATSLRRTLQHLKIDVADFKLKIAYQKLLVEVCDATGVDSCTTAGNQKIYGCESKQTSYKKNNPRVLRRGFYMNGRFNTY